MALKSVHATNFAIIVAGLLTGNPTIVANNSPAKWNDSGSTEEEEEGEFKLHPLERWEGSQANERLLSRTLARKFEVLQVVNAGNGPKQRGTHAKGICATGNLTVHEGLDADLRQGLFANPKTFDAHIRFANGASKIVSDHVPDARAISFSVNLDGIDPDGVDPDGVDPIGGNKQDFSMNNGPVFPIKDLATFNFLLEVGGVRGQAYQTALAEGHPVEVANAKSGAAVLAHIAAHPDRAADFQLAMKLGR